MPSLPFDQSRTPPTVPPKVTWMAGIKKYDNASCKVWDDP